MSKLPRHFAKLRHIEGFTCVKAFIQICLTSTLFCQINKTDAFEYFNTKFLCDRWKQKQPFTFWYCVGNFYPWKVIIGEKMSKLRSLAELGAFHGTPRNSYVSYIDSYIWQDPNLQCPCFLLAGGISKCKLHGNSSGLFSDYTCLRCVKEWFISLLILMNLFWNVIDSGFRSLTLSESIPLCV